jgi:adenylate cyclase
MFTDMVGYTALGQRNESLSLALVDEQRKLIRQILRRHKGREVKTMGDAFLLEFPNAVDAARCAYDIQRAIREFNISLTPDKRIHLRIGVHVGEIVESEGDISGDAVNIASRIEPFSEDGGVCLTGQVYDHLRNKFELPFVSLGAKSLKNVNVPIEVFKMTMPWDEEIPPPTPRLDTKRIAVLPFASMSPDPNDAFFADGITDEIISTVSGISGLEVISRTSVMGYKGTAKRVKDIGRELEVGSILEGSFRKAGNRIRITTQLIDVAGDKHLWAQSYQKELDDIFAVQADIAKQVAEALRVKIFTPERNRLDKKPTLSAKAHTAYLRGRYHWNRRGLQDIRKAQEYFQLAISEDPNFSLGYVGLADCYQILSVNWGIDKEENHLRARSFVAKALELEADLAEAHASNGLVLTSDSQFHGAESEFKRAIELKPSYASAHQWYSHILMAQSRADEAHTELEKALELDPFSSIITANLGDYYYWRRDYAKALDLAKQVVELSSDSYYSHAVLAVRYGRMQLFEDAEREKYLAIKLGRDFVPSIEAVLEAALARFRGDKQAVRTLMPELEKHFDEPPPVLSGSVMIAGYCFWLGEDEKGFDWLERSYSRKEILHSMYRDDDIFDRVRGEPRFTNLIRKIDLETTGK